MYIFKPRKFTRFFILTMIIPATPTDAKVLTEIALESKAHWGYTTAQLNSLERRPNNTSKNF